MYKIEEYKSLREEIGRNQILMAKTVQVGVTVSSGLIASSLFNETYGWILTFLPTLLLIPVSYHIANLCRKSWVIGRYIEFCLEPALGLRWESFSSRYFGNRNKKSHSKYLLTTILPLIAIQIFSPLFGLLKYKTINFNIWLPLFAATELIVAIEYVYLDQFSLSHKVENDIRRAINEISESTCTSDDIESNITP